MAKLPASSITQHLAWLLHNLPYSHIVLSTPIFFDSLSPKTWDIFRLWGRRLSPLDPSRLRL